MNPRSSVEFSNGIIEIFKVHKTYDLNILDCQRKGDVSCDMVSIIKIKNIQKLKKLFSIILIFDF